MTVMTYPKDGGERYPVQPGQTWGVPGEHPDGQAILTCGNLYDLPPLPAAALACTDLPWGNGPRNTFHTKAGVAHAEDPFSVFLVRALACMGNALDWAIEIGNRDADVVYALAAASGRRMQRYAVTYYGSKPCQLLVTDERIPEIDGTDEAEFTERVIMHRTEPLDVVTDPCTGRGLTAVQAIKARCRFVGYELSPWRCSVTLSKLADLTGQTPERIA